MHVVARVGRDGLGYTLAGLVFTFAVGVWLARRFQVGAKVTALYVIDPYPFTGVGAENPEGRVAYLSAANSEADYAMKTTSAALKEAGRPWISGIETLEPAVK